MNFRMFLKWQRGNKQRFFSCTALLCGLVSVIFFCTPIIAQSAAVSGTVREENTSEPVIGATVIFAADSAGKKIIRGTATNRLGFYSLPRLNELSGYLLVTGIGYRQVTLPIDFLGKKSATLDIVLKKESIQLKEVVIRDKRKENFTPTVGTVDIDPQIVRELPSFGGETDLFKVLQLMPGVKAASEISPGLYVRGGSPDQNLTLIDGVPVYNASHLGGFSTAFNPDAVNNMTLIKGAFPAEFGGRLSSILDISMREGNAERFIARGSFNTIGARLSMEGPLSPKATFTLSGRYMFLKQVLNMFPRVQSVPGYQFGDFSGKVSYRPSDEDKVYISAFASSDKLTEPKGNKDLGFDIGWKNLAAAVTWIKMSSAVMVHTTSLQFSRYGFNTIVKDKNPGTRPLDFYTNSTISDIFLKRELQLFFNEEHTIKAGAEIVYHNFNTATSDVVVQELTYRAPEGISTQAAEISLYAQDNYSPFEDLKFNIGARGYYFQNGKFLKFEPRASFTWYFFERFTFRGGVGIAHQNVHLFTRNDLYLPNDVWYPTTEAVKPARSVQGSLGFEALSYDKTFLFSVEGYYKKMNDIHEYRENASFAYNSSFENNIVTGYGEAFGFEFFINKRAGALNGWIGYTLGWTKRYFDDLNASEGFFPRFDRRHDVSFVLTYAPNETFSCGLTWTYGTGQAFALPTGQYLFTALNNTSGENQTLSYFNFSSRDAFRLDPFHKLDLSARYKTDLFGLTNAEFSLSIFNVYNRRNPFSKYIGYKFSEDGKRKIPVLKQFTLFPFLPTLGISAEL